jgi:hypothetical protein
MSLEHRLATSLVRLVADSQPVICELMFKCPLVRALPSKELSPKLGIEAAFRALDNLRIGPVSSLG